MAELSRLQQPLPAEVLRRDGTGLMAYQQYPAFSWTWLKKRTLLFALGAGSFACLIALAALAQHGAYSAWLSALQLFVGAIMMSSFGPMLATVARHSRLPPQQEKRAVIAALLLGIGVSFVVDKLVSSIIDRELGLHGVANTAPEPAPYIVLNILVLVVIYGMLGGGLALRRYLNEASILAAVARERELSELRAHSQLLDMRLSVLQAQIEPHFLFNTLASVRALIDSDPGLAATTIELLVDYLRTTIPRLRDTAVESHLGQQLDSCESYLKLMRVRMGRLDYRIDVPGELRELPFPPLLLHSLVENALKHGIEPKVGPGHVHISARHEHDRLVIRVADDGVGLRESAGSGVGLSNARDQLQTRYGARAGLTLASRAEGGALATITLPREPS